VNRRIYIGVVCVTHMIKEYATREIKLETIRMAVEECSKSGIPAIKEKLIVECGNWWGVRRQSAQELIKQLVANEAIYCNREDVWSYEQWEKIKDAKDLDYLKMEDILKGYAQKQLQTPSRL